MHKQALSQECIKIAWLSDYIFIRSEEEKKDMFLIFVIHTTVFPYKSEVTPLINWIIIARWKVLQ